MLLAILATGIALAGSVLWALRFAETQQQRDLNSWQARLNIIADSRLLDVNNWLKQQFDELSGLSANASLQLYMTELEQSRGAREQVTDEAFQTVYLRNLLDITAQRSGFQTPVSHNQVNANVQRVGTAGLALFDSNHNVVVSTSLMPPINNVLNDMIEQFTSTQSDRAISNVYLNQNNEPSVAFIVPVFALQGEHSAANRVGSVLGVRTLTDSLFPRLIQPGTTENTLETLLVTTNSIDNTITYLSPPQDKTSPLSKRLDANNKELASVFASEKPGQFALKTDYAFNPVLVTGRKVSYAPWTLVQKIDRNEAMADSDIRKTNLLTICLFFIATILATLIAVWRHGSYLRETESSARYRQLAQNFEKQKNLLSLIADNKPEAVFITDHKNRVRFANLEAARQAGMTPEQMVGKTLVNLLGKGRVDDYEKLNAQAIAENKSISKTHRFEDNNGSEHIIQTRHIPLSHIPTLNDTKERSGVLVLEQDITEPILGRERFLKTLNGLVETLVTLMDNRDQHTANHSARVAELARCIAEEMQLSPTLADTTETAGRLMNLGRMMVPLNLLNKIEELTEEEKQTIRNARSISADLLRGIEFEGPVIETIEQSKEHWDGKGPLGLQGNDILVTARIICVANAFISMRSPRAYRLLRTLDDALTVLHEEAGTRYDRAVIAALVNYMENRGGREHWKEPEHIEAIWVS